jgi:hypothetical protein
MMLAPGILSATRQTPPASQETVADLKGVDAALLVRQVVDAHRFTDVRPNTKISCEGGAILAFAGFVSFILLLDGPHFRCPRRSPEEANLFPPQLQMICAERPGTMPAPLQEGQVSAPSGRLGTSPFSSG